MDFEEKSTDVSIAIQLPSDAFDDLYDLALSMSDTPEQKARHDIDTKLTASGWLVRDRDLFSKIAKKLPKSAT